MSTRSALTNPKTFCIYPFVQSVIRTDGGISACCLMKSLSSTVDSNIQQAWHSESWQQLRNDMINGKDVISECWSCAEQEEKFGTSMRTQALRDYKFFAPKHHDQLLEHYNVKDLSFPNRLEIHVGNLCNLKCMTCRPEDSSALLSENKILKIDNLNQQDYAISDSVLDELYLAIQQRQIKILDLRGGESLLMPRILQFLKKLDSTARDEIQLRIQTNCTVLDHEWKALLPQFKQVEIMASIDSVGKYNTYIRYPSVWESIETNVTWFRSQPNIKLYVNCTVSNLNLLSLPRLIEWCKQVDVFCHFQILMWPNIFKYNNLPKNILAQAQQQLIPYQDIAPNINAIVHSHPLDDCILWSEFCNTVDTRDQYRKNRIFDLYPDLQLHWFKQVD